MVFAVRNWLRILTIHSLNRTLLSVELFLDVSLSPTHTDTVSDSTSMLDFSEEAALKSQLEDEGGSVLLKLNNITRNQVLSYSLIISHMSSQWPCGIAVFTAVAVCQH